ncbi:hypothetical protein BBJ28_00021240 [Nothophytophthora sp. Chile5]|nr:hypothetical protein BBJ28_00021240 [Nothophytophthora sp. Chile5]
MSGRPYARNPRAPFAGPTDLNAVLPHRFRLEAPQRLLNAKQLAIRQAIRRRCMQKNWKKMISIRHRRLADEAEAAKAPPAPVQAPATGEDAATAAGETAKSASEQQSNGMTDQKEVVTTAKRQLEELEQKLRDLTDQKHAKFQLLKEMLVEEARSKTSTSSGSSTTSASSVAKKRRVEFKESSSTPLKPASDPNAPRTLTSPGSEESNTTMTSPAAGVNASGSSDKPREAKTPES